MEFNNSIRREIYSLWKEISLELINIIVKYIIDNDKDENISKWIASKELNLKRDKKKLEFQINILIYQYTFYLLSLDKKDIYSLMNSVDMNLLTTILEQEKIKYEFETYMFGIEDIIKKNGINGFAIIYEDVICENHRKQNGEFYTDDDISKFITTFALNIDKNNSVTNAIDTMCGTGMFLKSVQDINYANINLWGIEKNRITAQICNQILQNRKGIDKYNINIINSNLFSLDINKDNNITTITGEMKKIPMQGFDLVVGNPAYIRYQALGYLFDEIPEYIKEYYISIGRKLEESSDYVKFVGIYIRALLLCKKNTKSEILENISKVLKKTKISSGDEWETLIRSYSGLSDSTVPTWFLSYKLCKEGGVIGYITSDSWLKKEYGNLLKKFFANNTKLKYVFDMSNINCFDDAQVNTSIVICQKSSDINLNNANKTRFVKFKSNHGKNVELKSSISKILYNNNLAVDSEQDIYIKFQKFIGDLREDYEDENVNIKIVNQSSLTIDDDAKVIEWGKYFQTNSVLEKIIDNDWETVEKKKISINQGLRSGYNNFFYFESVDVDGLISNNIIEKIEECDFKNKIWEELTKEEKLKINFKNIIYLPEDYINNSQKYKLVIFKYEDMGNKGVSSLFINKKNIRESIKSIKSINKYSIDVGKCKNYILDVKGKVIEKDFISCQMEYGEYIDQWILKGFGCVDISVEKYIDFYSKLKIKNKDQYIEVKDMPVLRTYKNKPSQDKIPTMWYTLNFTDRHLPDMFVNRINYRDLNIILNNKDKYIIDANFNTITFNDKNSFEKMIYFAIFNSITFKLQLENNCANLGGGALKVETNGLKKCKIPNINNYSQYSKERLVLLAEELSTKTFNNNSIIQKIDEVIIKEQLRKENVELEVSELIKEYTCKIRERITK